ncbi:MAG: hypothetical protein HY299_12025 [Verrucomicrobia bacterium]|nr:hypothetical protein [Verrucomicrobiota bacterium]
MKDSPPNRKDSEPAIPFKPAVAPPSEGRSQRVDYLQKSLFASGHWIRRLPARPPAARPTFRVTVG